MRSHPVTRSLPFALIPLAILALPALVGGTTLSLLNTVGLASIGAIGLNLVMGVAGQVSIGNAGFLAIGAFTAGLLSAEQGWPFLVVLPIGGLIAAVVGTLVGAPAVRVRGLYLVIATLAFLYVAIFVAYKVQQATVGSIGFLMDPPTIGSVTISTPRQWSYLIWTTSALIGLAVRALVRSRYGRAWMAIRDSEISAESVGISVPRYKLLAFTLSSAIVGMAGVMFAFYYQSVQFEAFTLDMSIQYLVIALIGGLGSIAGSYYGSLFVLGVPFLLQRYAADVIEDRFGFGGVAYVQNVVYGAFVVAFVLFEPQGIASVLHRIRRAPARRRSRRAARIAPATSGVMSA
ncbi:MAG: branched-chain amino acid ABC transporter permease [Acidimicrobiia bacterium]